MKNRLLTIVGIATALLFAEGAWVYAFLPQAADASRNASGTYSTPNTFVTGTVISSSAVNANFSDIATEMTDSLDRSGKGGMLAALRGMDGTSSAPAFSWTSETTAGVYRAGTGDLRLCFNGTCPMKWQATGTTLTLPILTSLGIGVVSPDAANPLYVTGSGPQFAVESRSGVNTRLGSNTYFSTTDKYTATGFASVLQFGGLTSADFIFYTAPSGTAGNTPSFTERFKVNESGATVANAFAVTGNTTLTGTLVVGSGNVSTITGFSRGGCTLDGASPSKCTVAVVTGQTCTASFAGTTAPPASGLRTNNPGGTVTVTGANGLTDGVNILCF